MRGCVGALNGWLCTIKTPLSIEIDNVRACFSGHYQTYGLHVQAVCDHLCRFTYIGVLAPNGSSDLRAYSLSSLEDIVQHLIPGYYFVSDNAYVCTENLLTPYSGRDKLDPAKDLFNFHLSQLHIRVEQSFGMLVNKWRVFKKPMQVKLRAVLNEVVRCGSVRYFGKYSANG